MFISSCAIQMEMNIWIAHLEVNIWIARLEVTIWVAHLDHASGMNRLEWNIWITHLGHTSGSHIWKLKIIVKKSEVWVWESIAETSLMVQFPVSSLSRQRTTSPCHCNGNPRDQSCPLWLELLIHEEKAIMTLSHKPKSSEQVWIEGWRLPERLFVWFLHGQSEFVKSLLVLDYSPTIWKPSNPRV